MSHQTAPRPASPSLLDEMGKVAAFVRRDLLVLASYRTALFTDWLGLLLQVAIFSFVARMIDPAVLPEFGGRHPTYVEFVAVGIGVGAFMQLGLARITAAIRQEQLIGTLESLLTAPVRLSTLQLGPVAFDVVYVPVRIVAFLALSAAIFDLRLDFRSLLPALAVGVAFTAVMLGVGIAVGAATLTFRRGSGAVGVVGVVTTVLSGAYFPLDLLPSWLQVAVARNPVALALDGMRSTLLGGVGWSQVAPTILGLVSMAVPALAAGTWAFRLALARELRNGSLGQY